MIDTVLAAGPFPIVCHVGSQYAWISSLFNQFKLLMFGILIKIALVSEKYGTVYNDKF